MWKTTRTHLLRLTTDAYCWDCFIHLTLAKGGCWLNRANLNDMTQHQLHAGRFTNFVLWCLFYRFVAKGTNSHTREAALPKTVQYHIWLGSKVQPHERKLTTRNSAVSKKQCYKRCIWALLWHFAQFIVLQRQTGHWDYQWATGKLSSFKIERKRMPF